MVSHGMDGVLVGGLGMGLSLVSDISNEAILVVGVVGHDLHSAVRKLDSVLSLDNSVLILTLCLGEVSAVFVSSSVLVSEWLRGQFLLVIRSGGWVVGGRGGIGGGSHGWGSHGGGDEEGRNKDLHCDP